MDPAVTSICIRPIHIAPMRFVTKVRNILHSLSNEEFDTGSTYRPKGTAQSVQVLTGFKTWQCALCAFVYYGAAGMPGAGITPGTRWQDVPETWSCPDCSASKGDFQMVEQEH